MAILNEDALDAIYRLIGDSAKKEAEEKREKISNFLLVATYIAIIAGILLLFLVPGIGSVNVRDAFSRFGYYVPGIMVIILGIVFIIINVTKFSNKKKPDDFDVYDYGKEHFQEYLSDALEKKNLYQYKNLDQLLTHEAIALADNLVSAILLSSETGTRYVGPYHAKTYTIYNYELTYNDGTDKTVQLADHVDSKSISIIKHYLPNNNY